MRRFPGSAVKLLIFSAITFLTIGLLASVIGNVSLRNVSTYAALFTDATGVEGGEIVRLAGVPVGSVTDLDIVPNGDQRLARITFTVDAGLPVFRDAQIQLRYENLVGRRYLAIVERPGSQVAPPDTTFPVTQTRPALNLTSLFNGFQPLFQALDPGQVNQLSLEIVRTLQGEAGTLRTLLAHTASLTSTIGDKDAVIGRVVANLNAVLATVDERDERLTELIVRFRDLMRGLAEDRKTLDAGLPDTALLLNRTEELLAEARAPLKADIEALGPLADQLAGTRGVLDEKLNRLPGKLATVTRTGSYGSWVSFYLCAVDAEVSLFGDSVPLRSPAAAAANERDTVCGLGAPR